jgi:hypothetical protein
LTKLLLKSIFLSFASRDVSVIFYVFFGIISWVGGNPIFAHFLKLVEEKKDVGTCYARVNVWWSSAPLKQRMSHCPVETGQLLLWRWKLLDALFYMGAHVVVKVMIYRQLPFSFLFLFSVSSPLNFMLAIKRSDMSSYFMF